jgi:hypothetical protein
MTIPAPSHGGGGGGGSSEHVQPPEHLHGSVRAIGVDGDGADKRPKRAADDGCRGRAGPASDAHDGRDPDVRPRGGARGLGGRLAGAARHGGCRGVVVGGEGAERRGGLGGGEAQDGERAAVLAGVGGVRHGAAQEVRRAEGVADPRLELRQRGVERGWGQPRGPRGGPGPRVRGEGDEEEEETADDR